MLCLKSGVCTPQLWRRSNIGAVKILGHNREGASPAGFTLAEVVVGFAVLGLVVASVFSVMGQGVAVVEISRDYARVSQIMQSEMETLRMKKWAEIQDLPAEGDFDPDTRFTDLVGDRYTCTRLVDSTRDGQVRVRVRVDWKDNGGRSHQREFMTLITKEGLNDYYYRTIN